MKILVVEDEPLIRLGLVDTLEQAEYEVAGASHADEAIRLLEADPDIRMVVTDVDMPGGMDGIRLAHYVRHRWPPVHLIVISGKMGVEASTLPVGARFMSKPYQEAQMLSVIRGMTSN